jgi:hypothetical protein
MKSVLIFALIVTAASVVLAQAPDSKTLSSPVADATRVWVQQEAKNLLVAAEEMPADKYSFRPTPQQMTFAHLMAHIGVSNRIMCSSIAGQPPPKDTGVTDKDGKDKLLADVKASFDYCTKALEKVDDSKLGEEIPLFARTRANVMMFLTADLADHYSTAAMYLRLNGLLPPTAQPKK